MQNHEFQLYVFGDYSRRNSYRDALRKTGKTFIEIPLETKPQADDVLSKIKMRNKSQNTAANFPILMKGDAVLVHGDVMESSLRVLLDLYGDGK